MTLLLTVLHVDVFQCCVPPFWFEASLISVQTCRVAAWVPNVSLRSTASGKVTNPNPFLFDILIDSVKFWMIYERPCFSTLYCDAAKVTQEKSIQLKARLFNTIDNYRWWLRVLKAEDMYEDSFCFSNVSVKLMCSCILLKTSKYIFVSSFFRCLSSEGADGLTL